MLVARADALAVVDGNSVVREAVLVAFCPSTTAATAASTIWKTTMGHGESINKQSTDYCVE